MIALKDMSAILQHSALTNQAVQMVCCHESSDALPLAKSKHAQVALIRDLMQFGRKVHPSSFSSLPWLLPLKAHDVMLHSQTFHQFSSSFCPQSILITKPNN